jgi:hypothetical protein
MTAGEYSSGGNKISTPNQENIKKNGITVCLTVTH